VKAHPGDPIDMARAFFSALNAGDAEAVAALYNEACVLEHVFLGDEGVVVGATHARERWHAEFERYKGALAGGHRAEVSRIASLETGWGWARAEWTAAVIEEGSDYPHEFRGYTDFWVEDGKIKRQRSRMKGDGGQKNTGRFFRGDPGEKTPGVFSTPVPQPVLGVGAVIVTDDRRVVLVKRRHEPLAGQWSLPGGKLELGETLEAGIASEVREETGLIVDVGPLIEVFDRILLDADGRVQHHFVLVDYLCRVRGGELAAGSDVVDVALASDDELPGFRLTDKALTVARQGLALAIQ
jgi:8-oxo-dGTP diphosphatase